MPIREISVDVLSEALRSSKAPRLLDVRRDDEHATARIDPCVLVPLHELPSRLEELDDWKGESIVVYCHHGVRSRSGAAILEAAGFTDVASLRGGIDAWSIQIDPKVPRY